MRSGRKGYRDEAGTVLFFILSAQSDACLLIQPLRVFPFPSRRFAERRPCLAAARSRHGSDSHLGCHSLPWRRFATPRGRLLKRILIVNSTPQIENSRKLLKIEQIPAVFSLFPQPHARGSILFSPSVVLSERIHKGSSRKGAYALFTKNFKIFPWTCCNICLCVLY